MSGRDVMGHCYLLGIDTGGTYTDAVLLDASTRSVLSSAKALTTKGDLTIGLIEAMTAAVASFPRTVSPSEIALVSVSTTLATNAVVEGHGGRVATVLIGFDDEMAGRTGVAAAFPHMPLVRLAGGHDHAGRERAPLDLEGLEAAVTSIEDAGGVDAYAIASAFSVRNADHELGAQQLIARLTGRPVTLSTELSSDLDAPRRALTAALNARLVPKVRALIDAVREAASGLRLDCPVMVMKGDGSLGLDHAVAARPIETVLSGPAASLVGAGWLSGRRDFLMSDMGGTTTDLAMMRDGRPTTTAAGATIGGWRTMVHAIDVATVGLGGDSEVHLEPGSRVSVGPLRVVPISLLAQRYPSVLSQLHQDLADEFISSLHGRFVLRPFGWSGETMLPSDLSVGEQAVMGEMRDVPVPARFVLRFGGAPRALARLCQRGIVQVAGLTPSDAAHVLGLQATWSGEGATLATAIGARFAGMAAPGEEEIRGLAAAIHEETVRRSAGAVLAAALGRDQEGALADPLVDAVASGRGRLGTARVTLSPDHAIVAVGGPARVVYPEVGRRIGTRIEFPDWCEVANAVGAATALVARSVTVNIERDGDGGFRLHGHGVVERGSDATELIERARERARTAAERDVISAGGGTPETRTEVQRTMLPGVLDDHGLLSARVTAESFARPATTIDGIA